MHPFYTHQQYLKKEIENLDLSKELHILEFGSGIGSGDIFKEYTNKYKNLFVDCYEHEEEWFLKCKNDYESDNYKFNLIDWEKLDYSNFKNKKYDLIFVDQGIWLERSRTVEELQDFSNVIIIHDFDYFNKEDSGYINGCQNIYSTDNSTYWGLKYNEKFYLSAYSELLPPTLVLKKK